MQPAPVLRCASSAALPRPDPTSTNVSRQVTPAWSTASRTTATGQGRYGTQPRGRSGSSGGISSTSQTRSSHASRSGGAVAASAAQKVAGVTRPPRRSDRRRAAALRSDGCTPIFLAPHHADDGSGMPECPCVFDGVQSQRYGDHVHGRWRSAHRSVSANVSLREQTCPKTTALSFFEGNVALQQPGPRFFRQRCPQATRRS